MKGRPPYLIIDYQESFRNDSLFDGLLYEMKLEVPNDYITGAASVGSISRKIICRNRWVYMGIQPRDYMAQNSSDTLWVRCLEEV